MKAFGFETLAILAMIVAAVGTVVGAPLVTAVTCGVVAVVNALLAVSSSIQAHGQQPKTLPEPAHNGLGDGTRK